MKRFSAPPGVYADPSRPPDDDDSDASSLSDGSKKVKTAQSFESLFNSEALSDIVLDINGGEYVFHAHKMIVGLKSERLAALITSVAAAPADNSGKPVLYLQEPAECSNVFSRFLYFIYSGAVWLHRDYVIPLFKLSTKYGVGALATHCENYIHQILDKMLQQDPASPLTQALSIRCVCDLFEEPGYRDDTKKTAFRVLCARFTDLARSERWISSAWQTVRDLLRSDDCTCEENLILVSATDWMKRNKLQDKARIQEILSSIRYPSLPRRVLYHLHATSSFRKFPPVQDLIDAAIRYHCFKDVPEAQAEFTGLQYRARGSSTSNRTTVGDGDTHNSAMGNATTTGIEDNNNVIQPTCGDNVHTCTATTNTSPCQFRTDMSMSMSMSISLDKEETLDLLNNAFTSTTPAAAAATTTNSTTTISANNLSSLSTLPIRRSRSEDRHGSPPQRDHRRRPESRQSSRRQAFPLTSSVSTFHSPRSPVAAVQPRVQGRRSSAQLADEEDIGEEQNNISTPSNATINNINNNNSSTTNNNNHNPHNHHHHHHLHHQHHHHHHQNVVTHSLRRGDHKNS